MLIFVRHGERADQVKTKTKIDFKFDPPLTPQGMM
jgi:broad specificity phosphatase PhoE